LFEIEAKEDNEAMEDEVESLSSEDTKIIEEVVDKPADKAVYSNWRGNSNKKEQERRPDLHAPKEYTSKLIPYIYMYKDVIGNIAHIPFGEEGDIADVLEEEGNFTVMKSDKVLADFSPSDPGIIVTRGIWTKQVTCLKRLIDIGYPFCVLYPLASLGKKGFSKQLKRCDTLTLIVLNKKYDFLTKAGESVDVDECAWYCGNFVKGFFEKSLYFAFTDEDDDNGDDDDDIVEIAY